MGLAYWFIYEFRHFQLLIAEAQEQVGLNCLHGASAENGVGVQF